MLLNKPYGVLSQFTDESTGHPTLKEYIDVPNLYAAGRLDRDSEGLLLLTDDGSLIKRLTDPKHHIEKTYWIMMEGDPTPEKLAQIERGIPLKDYVTLPAKTRRLPDPELPPRTEPVTPQGPPCGSRSNCAKARSARTVTHLHQVQVCDHRGGTTGTATRPCGDRARAVRRFGTGKMGRLNPG
jgi:pseudouridine synthase